MDLSGIVNLAIGCFRAAQLAPGRSVAQRASAAPTSSGRTKLEKSLRRLAGGGGDGSDDSLIGWIG